MARDDKDFDAVRKTQEFAALLKADK